MKTVIAKCCIAAVVVAGLMHAGCDSQSAAQQVVITPSSAVLHKDQSVTFTASGGFDYQWSLENEALGTLTSRTGPTVTYISLVAADSSATSSNPANTTLTQVLTVVSTIEGTSLGGASSTTNGPDLSRRTSVSASANISHR